MRRRFDMRRVDVRESCACVARGGAPRGATSAAAQMELAVIQGTVADEAGTPLDGVTIRLKTWSAARDTTLKSDKNGKFYRRGLQAIEYEMTVEKEGYQPINDKIRLSAGTERRLRLQAGQGVARRRRASSPRRSRPTTSGDFAGAAAAFEEVAREGAEPARSARSTSRWPTCALNKPARRSRSSRRSAAGGNTDPRVQFQLGGAYVDMKAARQGRHGVREGPGPISRT